MKKLITIILILGTTLILTAQEQFSEHYNYYTVETHSEQWFETDVTITFNVSGDNLYYQIHKNFETFLLKRTSNFYRNKTNGGMEYIAFTTISTLTGEEVIIQYFLETEYGVRLFINGDWVQLVRI